MINTNTAEWRFKNLDETTYNNLEGDTYGEKLESFRYLDEQRIIQEEIIVHRQEEQRRQEEIERRQNVYDILHPSQNIELNVNLTLCNQEREEAVKEAVLEHNEQQEPETIFQITPDQALEYEMYAIGQLCSLRKVIKHDEKITEKGKKFSEEYWITTTVQDVREILIKLKNKGKIKIGDVDSFMVHRLKGKSGGRISDSFKTARSKKSIKPCKDS